MMLVPGSENGYVEEASEYRFFLYRHWSLYDAMYHSPYVASKLGVWNPQGTVKLQVRVWLLLANCVATAFLMCFSRVLYYRRAGPLSSYAPDFFSV